MKFNESNMGRSMELGEQYGFIIISACRSDWDLNDPKNNEKINKKKTKELMSDIQSLGLSYIQVYGGYVEKGLGEVTEDSFFILNFDVKTKTYYDDMEFLRKVGIELCKVYNQDSFLFSAPNEKPYYIDKYGVEDTYKFGKIVFNAPTDSDHPYFTSFKKGGGGYDSKTGRFGKSDSRFRYENKGAKKMAKRMKEGAGAGYEVEFDGIELDVKKYKITDVKENQVFFDIPLKKGICDYWKAEGYYEGVDSEGIYYDGELMMEYDKHDREIVGGTAHCWLDIGACDSRRFEDADNPTNEEIDEYILENMPSSIDITWMYGGGWSHSNLDPKGFTLGGDNPYKDEVRKDNTTDYSYEFCVSSVDIIAPNMAEDVNWYFEHSYELEEIFFGEDDEEDFE